VTGPFLRRVGDSAVLVEFSERIDPDINDFIVRLAGAVEASAIAGVRDVVPAYGSLMVHFDPRRTDFEELSTRLRAPVAAREPAGSRPPTRIPVCYEGEFGPDLADVAAVHGITASDVVALHARPTYRVFMLGFIPGFPYMGIVDEAIATARLDVPRSRVSAGSVGIAGRQTGIYPADSPGGWRILGRTPVRLFDPAAAKPFRFAAGDLVQFYAIDRDEFDRASAA